MLAAGSEILTGEFARTVAGLEQDCKDRGSYFRGRQLQWLIKREFKGNAETERATAVQALTKLVNGGGMDSLPGFLNTFDQYVKRIGTERPADPDLLLSTLLNAVQHLNEFKVFMDRRDDADEGDELRGYSALRRIVDRAIIRRKEKACSFIIADAERRNAAGKIISVPAKETTQNASEKSEKSTKGKADKSERSASVPAEPALVSGVKGKGKGKGAECFEFRDSGTCKFGDKCHFEHSNSAKAGKGDSTPRPKASAKPKAKAKPKTASNPGSRTNSPGNTPPASPRSTELCNHFKRGTCTKGDKCRYSHAEVAAVAHALLRNSAAVAGSRGK
jgi:hypothetical protein